MKPGGLSVSRTFGDIEAKRESLGGKSGCVVPDPEISTRAIDCDDDFVIMGSDGIFDCMDNDEVIMTVWDTVRYMKYVLPNPEASYDQILGEAIVNVMKKSLVMKSEDNVTVMLMCFRNLLELV